MQTYLKCALSFYDNHFESAGFEKQKYLLYLYHLFQNEEMPAKSFDFGADVLE